MPRRRQGAERIVDLATLTGAVIIALGSTYSGLISNDDELVERVAAAGERTGEIAWRLPLHEEYDELIKGTYGDLDNAPEGAQGRDDRGRRVPVELRRRDAVGAPRHRRLGLGSRPRVRRQGRLRLRGSSAGGARAVVQLLSGCGCCTGRRMRRPAGPHVRPRDGPHAARQPLAHAPTAGACMHAPGQRRMRRCLPTSHSVRITRDGLRSLPRPRADPAHRARVRRGRGRARRRGARPDEVVPV